MRARVKAYIGKLVAEVFVWVNPVIALRMGFGVMYLYSGQSLVRHPSAWTWALPEWLQNMIGRLMPVEVYLRLQGGLEMLMALAFLAWFLKPSVVRLFALFAVLEMTGILFVTLVPWNPDAFLVAFRDIGLLAGAVALAASLYRAANTTVEKLNDDIRKY